MRNDHVSVIGLDAMGSAIAARLVDCGYPVTVFDHCRERVARMSRVGVRAAAIPADAGDRADVVLVNVPDDAWCFDVLLDHGGLGETLRAGSIVLDASPTSTAFGSEASAKLARFGITRVPVQLHGDARAAAHGRLAIVAGCAHSALAGIADLLAVIAGRITCLDRDLAELDHTLTRLPVLEPR